MGGGATRKVDFIFSRISNRFGLVGMKKKLLTMIILLTQFIILEKLISLKKTFFNLEKFCQATVFSFSGTILPLIDILQLLYQ